MVWQTTRPAPAHLYPSSIRSNFGVLARWGGWRTVVPPSFGKFAYGFLNHYPPAEQRRIYEEQATPETGRIFYQAAFAARSQARDGGGLQKSGAAAHPLPRTRWVERLTDEANRSAATRPRT